MCRASERPDCRRTRTGRRALAGALLAGSACALPLLPATALQSSLESAVRGQTDPHASERAFIEVDTGRGRWFLGERVRVHVRFGAERGFLDQLQPLFQRGLGLPLQVLAPWAPAPSGDAREPQAGPPDHPSLALNTEVVRARPLEDRDVAGSAFAVWEIACELSPERPGTLTLEGTTLRLAYATAFEGSLFVDQVATDTRIALVPAEAVALEIAALPEPGQPLDFGGAIGSFAIQAEVAGHPRVGDAFELVLRIQGEGNFGRFEAPRPEARAGGFDLRGVTRTPAPDGSVVRWELIPRRAGALEIAPVRLAYLEPATGTYRSTSSSALTVDVLAALQTPEADVRPDAGSPRTSLAPDRGHGRSVEDARETSERSLQSAARIALAGTVLVVVGIAVAVALRRARRPGGGPGRGAAGPLPGEDAAAAFRQALAVPDRDRDLGQLLCDYLAARLARSSAAIVDPALAMHLERAGTPPGLAGRTAALVEAWIGARYGGEAPAGGEAEALELVDELERAFGPGARRA